MSASPLRLTRDQARRLVVVGQLLSAPRPRTIADVVDGLGMVQMDPTSAVARTEHAEKDAPTSAGPAVSGAINELGEWLGSADIRFIRKVPAARRSALRT